MKIIRLGLSIVGCGIQAERGVSLADYEVHKEL